MPESKFFVPQRSDMLDSYVSKLRITLHYNVKTSCTPLETFSLKYLIIIDTESRGVGSMRQNTLSIRIEPVERGHNVGIFDRG